MSKIQIFCLNYRNFCVVTEIRKLLFQFQTHFEKNVSGNQTVWKPKSYSVWNPCKFGFHFSQNTCCTIIVIVISSPFSILCSPLDVDIIGKNGGEFAVAGNVDRFGRSLRLNSRFVCGDRIGQLNELAVDHDVDVGRELVRNFLVRFQRQWTETKLDLKCQQSHVVKVHVSQARE